MKTLLAALLCFFCVESKAATYYISPTGNDGNAGTLASPWRTLTKGWSVLVAGDILYVRGGTYITSGNIPLNNKSGTSANTIKIWNYPGEQPVFDWNGVVPAAAFQCISLNNDNWIHIKGIRVTNNPQMTSGAYYNYGFNVNDGNNNITLENCTADHIGGSGFRIHDSNNVLLLNCDAAYCDGPNGPRAHEDANGYEIAGPSSAGFTNTIKGCRAWWCADDGFDTFNGTQTVIFDSCWSFWNGYLPGTFTSAGDGNGFKYGQYPTLSTSILRITQNCLAFENATAGFDQNFDDNSHGYPMTFYNNTAYKNVGLGFFLSLNYAYIVKNNVSYKNTTDVPGGVLMGSNTIQNNNTWNGGVTLSDADFLSVSSLGVDGPRQADGSLPVLNFMMLSSNSDLIDKGVNVGLPFNGAALDIGAFESGTVSIAPNQPPVANAGTDKNITLPTNTITQSGGGADPDGVITSFLWTKIAGPATYTIASPSQAQTVINNLIQGVYQFQLQVTDNAGATATDIVIVTVNAAALPNQPPIANAGTDQNFTLPTNSLTQNGSGTDPDGTIVSYQWSKVTGPAQFIIISPSLPQTTINNLVQGAYKFELKVTDNQGAISRDTMSVAVNAAPPVNQSPTAYAGTDQNITLPANSITQTGSGSDPDGSITAYLWTKISGPATYNIVSPTQAQTVINNLVQGTYQFELKVTDNNGAIDRDTMSITVNAAPPVNQSPTANAGTDQNITLPTNSITQTGNGSDPDGSITAYLWTKISGPSTFNIVSPTQAQTLINNLVQGTYQFELRVTDNSGAIDRDTMSVTVNTAPPVNQSPTANAGADQNITLPANSITQNGSGSDPDGSIASYLWTIISGPVSYNIVSPTQAQTLINNLLNGTYQFELRVTDNKGAIDRDTMVVIVSDNQNMISTARLYPNPSTTTINIRIDAITNSNNGYLQILNVSGIIVYQKEFTRNQQTVIIPVDISSLINGIYFVKISLDINNSITLKFIKN